ncbi:MAG: hypothetical protein J7K11_05155 [Candidatus Hydrothermae bacterium]|nr:hypothetical protein [Candidatus Hydrothermae bacterium]
MKLAAADLFLFLVKWRKFILANIVVVAVVLAVLSFLVPPEYTASASIMPSLDQIMGMSMGQTGPAIGGLLSSIPTLPGFVSPSDIYASILKSRTIGEKIIDSLGLMSVYKTDNMEEALKSLYSNVDIKVYRTGIVEISCTAPTKMLAYRMAKLFVEELDRFNRNAVMTKGKNTRIFIERRLREVEEELKNAEEALREFNEKNKTVKLDEELLKAIEVYSDLKSQLLSYEVKRDLLRSISGAENPDLKRVEAQIAALKGKLSEIEEGNGDGFGAGFSIPLNQLPEKSIEYARLLRDVEVKTKLYAFLVEQYETAKIMESKDTPTLQVIEKAEVPEMRSWPKRKMLVLIGAILSLVLSLLFAIVFEYLDRNPTSRERWVKGVEILKRDLGFKR